ncbi:MAG: PAAR domain-containing protein [Acidobacteriota bacterium]
MGLQAAKFGDRVLGVDQHLIQPPSGSPVLMPHIFKGRLVTSLSPNVRISKRPAATVGSIAINRPPHVPNGGTFVIPPKNRGVVIRGSSSVFINGLPAARTGDSVLTCNDPTDRPVGVIVTLGSVYIGG